jgi:hypothetical protein
MPKVPVLSEGLVDPLARALIDGRETFERVLREAGITPAGTRAAMTVWVFMPTFFADCPHGEEYMRADFIASVVKGFAGELALARRKSAGD